MKLGLYTSAMIDRQVFPPSFFSFQALIKRKYGQGVGVVISEALSLNEGLYPSAHTSNTPPEKSVTESG